MDTFSKMPCQFILMTLAIFWIVVTQVPDDNTHDHDMTSEIGSQESLLAKNNVKLNIHPGRKIGLWNHRTTRLELGPCLRCGGHNYQVKYLFCQCENWCASNWKLACHLISKGLWQIGLARRSKQEFCRPSISKICVDKAWRHESKQSICQKIRLIFSLSPP